jgi:hypothetical protein
MKAPSLTIGIEEVSPSGGVNTGRLTRFHVVTCDLSKGCGVPSH